MTTHPPETATRTFGPRPPLRLAPSPSRRRLPRAGSVLGLVVVAALSLTVLAWPTGSRRSVAGPAPTDYAEVLEALDAQRAAAFSTGEVEALRRVYLAGTEVLRADAELLTAYARQGRRVAGLRHELASVSVVEEATARVVLRVVDRMPAVRVVAVDGALLARHAGRAERAWLVELVRVDAGWRIVSVAAA